MGEDLSTIALASGVTVLVGLVGAFLRGMFARNVNAADAQLIQLSIDVRQASADVRSALLELRTQMEKTESLRDRVSRLEATASAAHRRLDELHPNRSQE